MGWLFTTRRAGESIRDFLQRTEFTGADIVECAAKMRQVYIAYRAVDGTIRGAVALIEYRGSEIGAKIIDEEMGPFYTRAPRRVLDALSPTDNATAQTWRAACLEWNTARDKMRDSKKIGARIKLYGKEYCIERKSGHRRGEYIARVADTGAAYRIGRGELSRAVLID